MSADDGLDVVLTWVYIDTAELLTQARADVAQAEATSRELDELEARAAALRKQLGVADAAARPPAPLWSASLRPPAAGETATPEWEALRRQAEECLRTRDVDPQTVDLDDLLDPEDVRRIERRFIGSFNVQARLDRYDVAMILIAGLTAALVDYVMMGSPTSLSKPHTFKPTDSPLTAFFRQHSVRAHNPLSTIAHTPFDPQRNAATGTTIAGFRPRIHRDLTLGHDPLLELVFGVKDIMHGDLTTIGRYGQLVVMAGSQDPVGNPVDAIVREVAHLLSDAFTPMGLPAPGWTMLNSLQFGSFGAGDDTIADRALKMYTQGYDSRHFLTMSTSVAAAELVLRAYWALRNEFDLEFAEDVRREAEIAGSDRVSDHPRYQALAFGAHAVAAAANAGKVVLAGGNMLVVNYAEWLRFVQATIQFAQGRAVSPTDLLVRQGHANAEALARGWPEPDALDPAFPTLA
jgi:hypothetical protein